MAGLLLNVSRNEQRSVIGTLGVMALEKRRNHADLLKVFRMYRGLSVTPFNQFFATSLLTNTRGHTAKIQKARCNLDVRRFFFSERVIWPSGLICSEVRLQNRCGRTW